jgi:hypothetical protein
MYVKIIGRKWKTQRFKKNPPVLQLWNKMDDHSLSNKTMTCAVFKNFLKKFLNLHEKYSSDPSNNDKLVPIRDVFSIWNQYLED